MRRILLAALLIACGACSRGTSSGNYLFVWAGDSAGIASDFIAVIDANPASPQYGAVLKSLPTGVAGSHPHHTEAAMPADDHLLATAFMLGAAGSST